MTASPAAIAAAAPITVIDVADYAPFERPDMARPYAVHAAPAGESVVSYVATEGEARALVAEYAALTGTYMTSWGEQSYDTAARILHYVDTAPAAAPAPCTHWDCAIVGSVCVESGAPVMMPPRARRTYTATRVVTRLFEYVTVDADGVARPSDDEADFNDMPHYHYESIDTHTADSVAELVTWIRQDYVSFAAYGDGMTASDPDGSRIIDYATGERESVSWHCDGIAPALLERVIIPAVDAA